MYYKDFSFNWQYKNKEFAIFVLSVCKKTVNIIFTKKLFLRYVK